MELPGASACPRLQKVDPRVRRTRKLIMDALRDLMEARPFPEISVADIAERATINRATFYAHFEDKAHLAESMVREGLQQVLTERFGGLRPFSEDSLDVAAAATMDYMVQALRPCRTHVAEFVATFGLTIQRTLEATFLEWMAHDSQIRPSEQEALANALSWALYGAALRRALDPKRPDASAAAREVIALFRLEGR